MPKKTTKKPLPRIQVDDSPTGSVLPCPLCSQRFMCDTPAQAWRALYVHLRKHHHEPRAAELTQKVRFRIQRITWDDRHKPTKN